MLAYAVGRCPAGVDQPDGAVPLQLLPSNSAYTMVRRTRAEAGAEGGLRPGDAALGPRHPGRVAGNEWYSLRGGEPVGAARRTRRR